MSPRRKRAPAKPAEPAGLIASVSDPQVVSDRWYRTTVRGVWYLDVGDRLAMVYGGPGGWWWRAPGAVGRMTSKLRRAQLEAQRAVLAWCEAGNWRERRKRAPKGKGQRFVPTKADRAAAAKVAPTPPPEPTADELAAIASGAELAAAAVAEAG